MRAASSFSWVPLLCLLATGCAERTATPLGKQRQALSTGLVISQVYSGGGATGATYKIDYVEIFNRGSTTISLDGKSLQYATATETTPTWSVAALPSVSIDPGKYFLVALGAEGSSGESLPAPDEFSTSFSLSVTGGRVALVDGTSEISCGSTSSCSDTSVIDFVGYGDAIQYEGSGTTGDLAAATAALRKDSGCVETNDNKNDFTIGTPIARNSATAAHVCSVDAGGPDGSTEDASSDGATSSDAGPGETLIEDGGVADAEPEDAGGADSAVVDSSVEDTTIEETAIVDSSVEDTTIEETAVVDSSVEDTTVEETAVVDSSVEDTAIVDSAIVDTAIEDTAIADSAIVDTALEDTATAETAPVDAALEDTSTSDSALEDSAVDTGAPPEDANVEETADAAPSDGGDEAATDGGAAADPISSEGGGCGCRVPAPASNAGGGASLAGFAIAAWVVARRRR